MSETNDKIIKAFESINKQVEAHLVESIISLFHQRVLRHYVRNPRQTLDESNFKMTIEAANGVTFEGREKLIELEQEVERLKEENQNLLNFRILDNARLSKKIFKLDEENKRLKGENFRMRNCLNCNSSGFFSLCTHPNTPTMVNNKCNLWEIKK